MRFQHYMLMQEETRRAFANYNLASVNVTLAQIRERAAELSSQSFESVGKGKLNEAIGPVTAREREVALNIVRYVVYGRSEKVEP